MNEIVNCAVYQDGNRLHDITIDQINLVVNEPDKFVWAGLHEPGEETLEIFQKQLMLHDLAVEDAHNAHQRPKFEIYGDSFFIVMRTAQLRENRKKIDFGETHFFLGSDFLITVRHGSTIAYTDVRKRCEDTPELLRKGPGFALYAVMDSIVDQYFPVVDALEEELLEIEEKVFKVKPTRKTTEGIYLLKRQLLEVKRAVSPLPELCNRLMRFDTNLISADTKPYFRDVYDHTVRINETVDHARDLLNTALEANFSLINISQSEISKKFAGWAAILAVPTLVAGYYGMNFKFMPELNWHYGYPAVVAFTILSCAVIFYLFRRAGWL